MPTALPAPLLREEAPVLRLRDVLRIVFPGIPRIPSHSAVKALEAQRDEGLRRVGEKTQELTAAAERLREQVRSREPQPTTGGA
jgi:hypothetical protein